jgi:hypothetical protein
VQRTSFQTSQVALAPNTRTSKEKGNIFESNPDSIIDRELIQTAQGD